MTEEEKRKKYEELIELQKKYENGEISDLDINLEDLKLLCKLYKIQIKEKTKSNEEKRQKLLKYKKN